MSTIVNISDHTMDNAPVFWQLAVGQWFMYEGNIYCKTEELRDNVGNHYNAFAPDYSFEYFETGDTVEPIEEINIQILK